MNLKAIAELRAIRLIKETGENWLEDNCLRLSAALSYYSIFSIAPLLVIAISIAGMVLGPEAEKGRLGDQLSSYLGPPAAAAIQSMVQSASKPAQSKVAAIVGVVTLLFGASGVFGQLKDALNTIWEVKLKSGAGVWGFIRERFLSFGMVLVIGFLLLVSLMLSTGLAAMNEYLGHILKLPGVCVEFDGLCALVCRGYRAFCHDLQGASGCDGAVAQCMGGRGNYRVVIRGR